MSLPGLWRQPAFDGLDFRACREAQVDKAVFASSGCVYLKRTDQSGRAVYLIESMVGPPYDADNMCGWLN